MNKYNYWYKKADRLVKSLKLKVKNNPDCLCENYGQKEIGKFIDKMEMDYNLTYVEKCNIKDVLWHVNEISYR